MLCNFAGKTQIGSISFFTNFSWSNLEYRERRAIFTSPRSEITASYHWEDRRKDGLIEMTTAAEEVAGTSYLLEEILIRLPAKSLARSKLVSKQWFSQISNPQFLQLHYRHRPNKSPTGIFLADFEFICGDANIFSFSDVNPTYQTIPSLGFLYDDMKQLFGDKFSEIVLLDSCNGLLLCLVTFKQLFIIAPDSKYCVCNPTTKKFRLLPPAPFLSFSFSLIRDNDYLAFDPSLSLHYKVIICTKSFRESHHPHKNYIYSSENKCWSTIASPFDTFSRREWFFLNGSMYCAVNSLRLDVYTEKMENITMPPKMGITMPVIGSHVYCVVGEDHRKADLQVLEMSSDFSEWIPKYDANVSPLLSVFPEIAVLLSGPGFEEVCYCFYAICVVDGVKEDEPELVLGIPGKLISYNLKEKTAKELVLHGELSDINGFRSARVYQFIECLFVV